MGSCGRAFRWAIVAGLAAATPILSATPTPVGAAAVSCPGAAAQSMDGAVAQCIQVGALAPGAYHATVEQFVGDASFGAVSPGPPVRVTLSPAAGGPGTVVRVTGRLARPVSHPGDVPFSVGVCWGGCPGGLEYSTTLQWTSATTFTTSIEVPAAPWIDSAPVRIHRLTGGTYRIGVQCLTGVKGCGLGPAEGTAPFRLHVPAEAARWCPTATDCGELTATRSAYPAGTVRVSGHVPLQPVIGSDQAFVNQVGLVRGAPAGPEVTIARINAIATRVDLGHAPVRVLAAPAFSGLGRLRVVATQLAGEPAVSANPAAPATVAWCTPGAVDVEGPSGIRRVPTAGVTTVLAGAGLPPPESASAPSCSAVALADGAVVAGFDVYDQAEGIVEQAAVVTTDAGATWRLVPVPAGDGVGDFGDLTYRGDAVDAVFAPRSDQVTPPVEQTTDGSTWTAAALACPASGRCATFGALRAGNCAMNGSSQTLLYSTDGGRAFREADLPHGLEPCVHAELAATPTRLLLADASSPYLLVASTDRGRTWHVLALPTIPGLGGADDTFDENGSGITVLPDGSLLVTGSRGTTGTTDGWDLLTPGATRWCQVRGLPAGTLSSSESAQVEVIGARLWWLPPPSGPARSVALTGLRCG